MDIDLRGVPFSRNGAFLAFSLLPAGDAAQDGRPAGLYMRSVHGGAQSAQPQGRVALLEPLVDGRPAPYQVRATPAQVELVTARGTLRICIPEPFVVRVRGDGVGLRLTFNPRAGDYALPTVSGTWRINSLAFRTQFMLSSLAGLWSVDAPWTGSGAERLAADLLPDAGGGVCEGVLEEFESVPWPGDTTSNAASFDECVAAVQADFDQWLNQTPSVPVEYTQARSLAAYINWSSMVEPSGLFLRPAMLTSKNEMTNIWAWDHCFNAMALTYRQPVTAWDQFMTPFDQQDEHGGLPYSVNDRELVWNFCKPPIHGWTLQWITRRTPFIRPDQVRQIYGPLCRWTEWWFQYRDDDQDGLPQYHHGNDSGWDNATPFDTGVPLESPDLCAFLVLQMETLAEMAAKLKNQEEAESWQRRSEELRGRLLAHFWQGDHFVALRSGDHLVADTESLFLYLPLILGRRLPAAVRSDLIAGLTRPGRFLTPYGLATESPASPAYTPDGCWRGPVWAPPTFFLVEGLAACGELDMARDIARRFCDLCARSGFAENFDALTGEGLRDRACTWTAAVFLLLAHEYL
jgi:hypothetical protein